MTDWIKKIKACEKKLKEKHESEAKESECHYYNDDSDVEFPIYWSSIQVQRSALFAKAPNPEIRTRIAGDDAAKDIAQILEDVIVYEIDNHDFHNDFKRTILDYLLVDKGVLRVNYNVKNVVQRDPFGNPILDENGQPLLAIGDESVTIDHWSWKRFVYDIGKDWNECEWIAYKHYMTAQEIEEKYEKKVKDIELEEFGDDKGKICIYELWDKKERKIYDLKEGESKPLRVRKDSLKLKGFFDCPRPMISNMRSDKFIPQSEYKQIKRQLLNIDNIERRIDALVANIRDVGFYDAATSELAKLATAKDGELIPVDNLLQALNNSTTFDKIVAKLPIIQQAQVVEILRNHKKEQKEQIYEITGLSDIIRGSTRASETATAQQIKGQWASVRLQEKQNTINSCLREIMRMYGEIIAEHFTIERLQLITGMQVTPELKQRMSDDLLRCYAIDIETDSTIMADESQDRQDRMEMVNTMAGLLQTFIPAVQQGVLQADIAKELLLTAVRGYKYSRGLEDMITNMDGTQEQFMQLQQQIQQVQQQAQQMQMDAQGQLQQAGQQIQQLQNELGRYQQGEEQRENIKVQAEAEKDLAQANKWNADAQKLNAETIGQQQLTAGYVQY